MSSALPPQTDSAVCGGFSIHLPAARELRNWLAPEARVCSFRAKSPAWSSAGESLRFERERPAGDHAGGAGSALTQFKLKIGSIN
jgi:hypothetical protein